MKLLCVSHPCVAPVNQELYGRIAELSGWEVTIVLPSRWRNELAAFRAERWPGFAGGFVPLRVLGQGRIPLHVYVARLGQVLRRERPDVVYVHNEPYALSTYQAFRAAARAVPGAPLGFYSAQNVRKRYPLPFSACEAYVHRHASFAVPVSGEVASILRAKGFRGDTRIVPLPAPDPTVARVDRTGEYLHVAYLGRLVQEKGVDVLLDALARLPDDVRATIAGSGPEESALRERAASLGLGRRVSWRGYVPHERSAEVLAEADVVVVPSRTTKGWREQFGRVVVEALAVGVPVIASSSGELPHLVASTGGGWTFPENDPSALAVLLRRLADDRSALASAAERGRSVVRERYSMTAVATGFIEALEAACARRVPAGALGAAT